MMRLGWFEKRIVAEGYVCSFGHERLNIVSLRDVTLRRKHDCL